MKDNITDLYVSVMLSFIISFLLTFITIPKIIRVSYRKQLMDIPGSRSSHIRKVPRLGGVAIYFAILVVTSIFCSEMLFETTYFVAALVFLFFIGLMDDLLIVAPRKKLITQLISAAMIVIGANVRIESFFGLFGIYELPYLISVAVSIFTIIVIINSYNLIDGIDGLASGVGILISLSFVFIFFRLFDYSMGYLAIAIMASLLAFLYFNLSNHYKIFMGDTGSMVVGYLIAFMAIKFLNLSSMSWVMIKSGPVVAIAILIVPLVDTLSVFIIRILQGKSPFTADQNHIHHRLIRLGFTHVQTTLLICAANALIIGFAYSIRNLNLNLMFILVVLVALSLSFLPLLIGERLKKKKALKKAVADFSEK